MNHKNWIPASAGKTVLSAGKAVLSAGKTMLSAGVTLNAVKHFGGTYCTAAGGSVRAKGLAVCVAYETTNSGQQMAGPLALSLIGDTSPSPTGWAR